MEFEIGELLLEIALFFIATYLLAGLLTRVRIPGILAALIIAMAVHYTPFGDRLLALEFKIPLSFLAQLLLTAVLIDIHLFTALIAASSVSTIVVPLLFALMIRQWGDTLRQPAETIFPGENQ